MCSRNQLYIFRQYTTSLSNAAWPYEVRRCIATNKAAQGRRLIIMKGLWWQSTDTGAQDLEDYQDQDAPDVSQDSRSVSMLTLLRQQIMTAFLIAGIALVMFVLYQWSTMLLLVVIGAVTCIVTFRLLLDSKQSYPAEQTIQAVQVEEEQAESVVTAEVTEVEETPGVEEPTFIFPDTPMPSSPLIRVLETIDLSTSNVEHFIKTSEHSAVSPKKHVEEKARVYTHEDMSVNE